MKQQKSYQMKILESVGQPVSMFAVWGDKFQV